MQDIDTLFKALKKDRTDVRVPKNVTYIVGKNDKNIRAILTGLIQNKPVFLQGFTGCGKSTLVKWLCQETGNSFSRVQITGGTEVSTLIGRYLVNNEVGTYWVDGVLTEAVKKGYWILLDELNAALPEVLFLLNKLLDDDCLLSLDDKDGTEVAPHPDFRLFVGINPVGDYAGTKEINRSLLDRFAPVIKMNYPDPRTEKQILLAKTKLLDKDIVDAEGRRPSIVVRMIDLANDIRKLSNEDSREHINFHFSIRQLIDWGNFIPYLGIKEALKYVVLNKAEYDDAKKIEDHYNNYFRPSDENFIMEK